MLLGVASARASMGARGADRGSVTLDLAAVVRGGASTSDAQDLDVRLDRLERSEQREKAGALASPESHW